MQDAPRTATAFDALIEGGADLGHLFETRPIPEAVADTPEALLAFLGDEADAARAESVGRAVAEAVAAAFGRPDLRGPGFDKAGFLENILPAFVCDEVRKGHPGLDAPRYLDIAVAAARRHANPRVAA